MHKLVTIVGARPQFIKAAVVSRAIAEYNAAAMPAESRICEVIVHSGQHYDINMSSVFFEEMQIPKPAHFLDVNGMSHGAMTGRMIETIESVLMQENPELVLVFGDTNTTLAGALAAVKLHIPVAHVEAGLRSFNRRMPEEINRLLTDHVAEILFCPTQQAVENLRLEGIGSDSRMTSRNHTPLVSMVGDVMLDAAMHYKKLARKPEFDLPESYVLATLHRAENTDAPGRLVSLIKGLEQVGKEIPVVVPVHPRTRKIMEESNMQPEPEFIRLIEPVGYLSMIYLIEHCRLVMTDSGGLQKEAYFFKKPCVTLRDETEWVELVENGLNLIAGADTEKIYQCYREGIEKKINFELRLYGDGSAGNRIVRILLESFK
jgi:UDP-GlcNAc3NAcA epimerase